MTCLNVPLSRRLLPIVTLIISSIRSEILLCHGYSSTFSLPLVPSIHSRDHKTFLSLPPHWYATSTSKLDLVPLSSFSPLPSFLLASDSYRVCLTNQGTLRSDDDDTSSIDSNPYVLCVAEEKDLPSISHLTMKAFGNTSTTVCHSLSPWGSDILHPVVGVWNMYAYRLQYMDVFLGLRSRMKGRFVKNGDLLGPPNLSVASDVEKAKIAKEMSLFLALARSTKDDTIDVIATVELRLQPLESKVIYGRPYLNVWRDIAIMILNKCRKSWSATDSTLQPYLANLCVAESFRGRKIGRALLRCMESLVRDVWGYHRVYLHVDMENLEALHLYQSEGYRYVKGFCNYFVKEFV